VGTSADGEVKINVDGKSTPLSVEIPDAAMEKGANSLGSSLTEALMKANEESKKAMGEKMAEMYQVNIRQQPLLVFCCNCIILLACSPPYNILVACLFRPLRQWVSIRQ